jgi:SOS-response transcriptional repressor LexA
MNVKTIRRENMRALAKSVGGINQLALRLNKAQSQMSHLIGISPTKNIGDRIAAQVEAAFAKPIGWLDREHYSIEDNQAIYRTEQGDSAILCRQVPLISWQEAKEWHQLAYEYRPKTPSQLIGTTSDVGEFAFALRVHGDSMESTSGISFPAGVVIVADPDQIPIHSSFVIVSETKHKEATLKQLASDGNKKYLKPLNPGYPITEYTVSMIIHGVVKQMVCNFLSELKSRQ